MHFDILSDLAEYLVLNFGLILICLLFQSFIFDPGKHGFSIKS